MYKPIREGGYIYQSLPYYRPLSKKHAVYLSTLWLNALIRTKLHLGDKAPPLFIVIDEAQVLMAHDVGLLQFVLDSGRSLGIFMFCICHTLSQVKKSNPELLESVKQNCQVKGVGRGQNLEEYMTLAQMLHGAQWTPTMVRDERIRKNAEGEDEVTARQLKEIAVFCFEKAVELSGQETGEFTWKVKGKTPERYRFALRTPVVHDFSKFHGRRDYLKLNMFGEQSDGKLFDKEESNE